MSGDESNISNTELDEKSPRVKTLPKVDYYIESVIDTFIRLSLLAPNLYNLRLL